MSDTDTTADPELLDWVFGETDLENSTRRTAERPARRAARAAARALLDLRIASATDLEVTAANAIQQVCSAWLEDRRAAEEDAEEAYWILHRFDLENQACTESWPVTDSDF